MKCLPILISGVACLAASPASSSRIPAQYREAAPAAALNEQVIDLPLGASAHQRILYDAPPHPRATLVMLPGGSGEVGLQRDGTIEHDDNFVVRTRAAWVARGYAVLVPDTVGGANLRGSRSAPGYGRLVDDLARYARSRASAPVFLMGTSQGSIAAMNGAAQAPRGLIDGLILTESVSVMGHSGETVFDAAPQDVHVPALVVANKEDRCDVAPPTMAPHIAAAMRASPDVRVLSLSGGMSGDDNPCSSLSPHGYYGIEARVLGAVSDWLRAHGG